MNLMLKNDDPGEVMLACLGVIMSMKGPFESATVKKNVRKLLAKSRLPTDPDPDMELQAEHFKVSAADDLMSKYFIQVA